jgi:opacity protein-like surface antigen
MEINMKLEKSLTLGAGALLAAGSTFGQSQSFVGNQLSLGAGQLKFKNESDTANDSRTINRSHLEFTHFKSLDDNWLLGFGVGIGSGRAELQSSLGGTDAVSFYDSWGQPVDGGVNCNSTNCYAYQGGAVNSQVKVSKSIEISLIPAYAFSRQHLAFVRIGVSSAKFTKSSSVVSGTWLDSYGSLPIWGGDPDYLPADWSSGNTAISGMQKVNLLAPTFGIGYRYQNDDHWFFQAEYRVMQYKKNINLGLKPSVSGLMIGLGYRF